jgi:hypothetical protein
VVVASSAANPDSSGAREYYASTLDQVAGATDAQESFLRTFPSTSIPAYGLLLDASSEGWRQRLRATDDLGILLMKAFSVQPAPDAAAAAARYGGAEIRAAEEKREQARQARLAELRRRFVDGPVLRIPAGGSGSSDSRGSVVIPGVGTVFFGPFSASGPWGTLAAEKGVLVASGGGSRSLAAPARPDGAAIAGDGWSVKAAPGWVVREGARPGDYEVVRQQP